MHSNGGKRPISWGRSFLPDSKAVPQRGYLRRGSQCAFPEERAPGHGSGLLLILRVRRPGSRRLLQNRPTGHDPDGLTAIHGLLESVPGVTSPTTSNESGAYFDAPKVSSAFSAYPSIAERSKFGTSNSEQIGSAKMRPPRCFKSTVSFSRGGSIFGLNPAVPEPECVSKTRASEFLPRFSSAK